MSRTPTRICVDWDGTLVEDDQWPEQGMWLPGAVHALKKLSTLADEVVIFSCRTANVDTDEISHRDNVDQINSINTMLFIADIPCNVLIWEKPHKPPANLYIDNRGLRFNGDWETTLVAVEGALEVVDNWGDPGDEQQSFDFHKVETIWDALQPRPHYMNTQVRTFDTGATRDTDEGKLDYEGFLSPWALEAFAQYMHTHRVQSDGTLRSSDNWQKGIPTEAYMKSMFRHFMAVWTLWRAGEWDDGAQADLCRDLCALMFNVQGMLHELVKPT
jgi:hypothetical protein